MNSGLPLKRTLVASAITLAMACTPVLADTIFTTTNDSFAGRVSAGAAERGAVVHPGSAAIIAGRGLIPGQQITLMRGNTILNDEAPIIVDDEGAFGFDLVVDDDAMTGLHPIVVIAENPAAATVTELKVSAVLDVFGEEQFAIDKAAIAPRFHQVDYSAKSDALFATSTVGRPPIRESVLWKIDPASLEVLAQITPAEAPARDDGREGGLFAVYGVAVDDVNGTIWTTNTRQDTVAVYRQDDLSLVRQMEPGEVQHARDVVIDATRGRAFVSAATSPSIEVYDTKTLKKVDTLTIESRVRGEQFGTMSLSLDADSGKLMIVSLRTPEAAIIDLETGETRMLSLPGAQRASGVAYDAQDDRLYVASQGTDNLLILDAASGEVLHDIEVGAGALNVDFEPRSRLAFISSRAAGTVAVVNTDGRLIANLDGGKQPNQVRADGRGNVFAVNMAGGGEDQSLGSVRRIRLQSVE